MARPRLTESDEVFQSRQTKSPRAILYVSLGTIAILSAAVIYPVVQAARPSPVCNQALSRIKQAALACQLYATDHDDHLPRERNWMDDIEKYVGDEPDVLRSPIAPPGEFGIGFRRGAGTAKLDSITKPNLFALLFDSTNTKKNACGTLELLPSPPRYDAYGGVNVIAFADGHAGFHPWPGNQIQ